MADDPVTPEITPEVMPKMTDCEAPSSCRASFAGPRSRSSSAFHFSSPSPSGIPGLTNRLHANNPVPGQFFLVDGRQMHINCTGIGTPTIVIEAGLGSRLARMARRPAAAFADGARLHLRPLGTRMERAAPRQTRCRNHRAAVAHPARSSRHRRPHRARRPLRRRTLHARIRTRVSGRHRRRGSRRLRFAAAVRRAPRLSRRV